MNTIESVVAWHAAARPEPTAKDFCIQLSVHLEEVAEMLAELDFTHAASKDSSMPGKAVEAYRALVRLSDQLRSGTWTARIEGDRENFLKELCDQVVTAAGVAYCSGMDFPTALHEVNRSNFSKFDAEGKPMRDPYGKIMKSPRYEKPNLRGTY